MIYWFLTRYYEIFTFVKWMSLKLVITIQLVLKMSKSQQFSTSICWNPPRNSQYKLYCDGSVKLNSSQAVADDGVFRDHKGSV